MKYSLYSIRTLKRNEKQVTYACIKDLYNELCVSATLDYCLDWLKNKDKDSYNKAILHLNIR